MFTGDETVVMRGHTARCPGWRTHAPGIEIFMVGVSCTPLHAESSVLIDSSSTSPVVAQWSMSSMTLPSPDGPPSQGVPSKSFSATLSSSGTSRRPKARVLQLTGLRWTIRHQPQNLPRSPDITFEFSAMTSAISRTSPHMQTSNTSVHDVHRPVFSLSM